MRQRKRTRWAATAAALCIAVSGTALAPSPAAAAGAGLPYGVSQPVQHAVRMSDGTRLAVDVYDRRRMWLNARYRVRWLTRRMDKERLHRLCETLVPLYMRLAPPLHPWNQLLVPLKDYRGALPGLSREQEAAWSVLDTFDMLSPAWDQPQYRWTVERWS